MNEDERINPHLVFTDVYGTVVSAMILRSVGLSRIQEPVPPSMVIRNRPSARTKQVRELSAFTKWMFLEKNLNSCTIVLFIPRLDFVGIIGQWVPLSD